MFGWLKPKRSIDRETLLIVRFDTAQITREQYDERRQYVEEQIRNMRISNPVLFLDLTTKVEML